MPEVAHATANTSIAVSMTYVEFRCDENYEFPDKNRTLYVMCTTEGEWNVTAIPGCQGGASLL